MHFGISCSQHENKERENGDMEWKNGMLQKEVIATFEMKSSTKGQTADGDG